MLLVFYFKNNYLKKSLILFLRSFLAIKILIFDVQ